MMVMASALVTAQPPKLPAGCKVYREVIGTKYARELVLK
jgi:hypothetical protein